MERLAEAVTHAVIAEQDRTGYPDMVPAFAELRCADGKTLWYPWENLTVAVCNQLVEHHSRKGRTALKRWRKSGSKHSLKTAARHILCARIYREKYFWIIGIDEYDEDEMPFPYK